MSGALRELFAKFFVDFDASALVEGDKKVDATGASLNGLFGIIKKVGNELTGGGIAAGLVYYTKRAVESARENVRVASTLGMATDELQRWKFVATMGDVESGDLTAGLKVLQRQLFAAAEGSKEAVESFTKLGLTQKDLKDADVGDVLERTADAFSKLENKTEKVALAQKIFGRAGNQMIPLLEGGAEAIRGYREEFEALGGASSEEYLAATERVENSLKRFDYAVNKVIGRTVTPLVHAWGWLAEKAAILVTWFAKITRGTNFLNATLAILVAVAVKSGAAILAAFWPVLAPFVILAAKAALFALALDDVMSFLKGSDSLIGRFLDATFGMGTSVEVLNAIKDAWASISEAVSETWTAMGGGKGILRTILDMFDAVADAAVRATQFIADYGKIIGSLGQAVGELVAGRGIEGFKDAWDAAGRAWDDRQQRLSDRASANAGQGAEDETAAVSWSGKKNKRLRAGEALPTLQGLASVAPAEFPVGPEAPMFSAVAPPPSVANETRTIETNNTVSITVAADAKADPNLGRVIKASVQEALDENDRKVSAGMRGF